jgi:hypothetical protein
MIAIPASSSGFAAARISLKQKKEIRKDSREVVS